MQRYTKLLLFDVRLIEFHTKLKIHYIYLREAKQLSKRKTIFRVHFHKDIAYFTHLSLWRENIALFEMRTRLLCFHTVIKVKCQKQNGKMAAGARCRGSAYFKTIL